MKRVRAQTVADPGGNVVFTKLSLHGEQVQDKDLLPIYNWTPAGHGIDVAWNRNGIYVMKKRGVMRWIDDRIPCDRVRDGIQPAFDGNLSTTYQSANNSTTRVLVIDPEKEVVNWVPLGLPPCFDLQVAALSPGKASCRPFRPNIRGDCGIAAAGKAESQRHSRISSGCQNER